MGVPKRRVSASASLNKIAKDEGGSCNQGTYAYGKPLQVGSERRRTSAIPQHCDWCGDATSDNRPTVICKTGVSGQREEKENIEEWEDTNSEAVRWPSLYYEQPINETSLSLKQTTKRPIPEFFCMLNMLQKPVEKSSSIPRDRRCSALCALLLDSVMQ
ncbi:hypothetical protein ACROYT_G025778 [Oculina patagonica]